MMNLISNNDNTNNSGWGQPSNTSASNSNLDVDSTDLTKKTSRPSQWMFNNNQNNSTNASNVTNNTSQANQSSDSKSASPSNECTNLPNNWSQVVETTNTSSSSNIDSQPQSNNLSNETKKPNLVKNNKFVKEIYSYDWGMVAINQNTSWNLSVPSNYQPPPKEIHSWNGIIDNSWRFLPSTNGTDFWEANIRKKANGSSENVLSNQASAQKWKPFQQRRTITHWDENSNSNVWNGPSENNGYNTVKNNNWLCDTESKSDKNSDWLKSWNDSSEKPQSNNALNGFKVDNQENLDNWDVNLNTAKTQLNKTANWNENEINNQGGLDGTSFWNKWKPNGNNNTNNNNNNNNNNTRWKDENDMKQIKSNNIINLCANGSNAQMQNNHGFSAASPGVLRIPSNITALNKEKNNWSDGTNNWNDKNAFTNNNSNLSNNNNLLWNDPNNQMYWNKQNGNKVNNSNSGDNQILDANEWSNSKNKIPSKEAIFSSNQFKTLVEMGFKKENVEAVLRKNNIINMDEAIDELRANVFKESGIDIDRRKVSGFNQTSSLPPNLSIINNCNTSQTNQMPLHQIQQQNQIFRNNVNMASTAEKRLAHLAKQIQLAVQNGHLNAQILNQPLNVKTIQLINELLQQLKTLQTLQNVRPMGQPLQSELNVHITQTKQRISNLRNQIKVQHISFLSQQLQSNNQQNVPNNSNNANVSNGLVVSGNINTSGLDFKSLILPETNSLTNEFKDLQINQNQSRLNTWKSSFDNDLQSQLPSSTNNSQNFSRAPGSVKQATNLNNISPIANSWASLVDESWINETNDLREVLNLNLQGSTFSNNVPEFEPGKPWKGSAKMKSSDDDPHLTPGSVNRSIMLSLNNSKDRVPFYNNWPPNKANTNVSNNFQSSSSLSSNNTWSFNNNVNNIAIKSPNWQNYNNDSAPIAENSWQESGAIPKAKGPPPGLSPSKSSKINSTNSWNCGDENLKHKNISSYLLLRNLTPQFLKTDASTLKTLCLQHGPLQLFNLFLNNGIVLVKYNTKEEAIKAQGALNNCVLGSTTILVDLLSESEVQQYLSGQQQVSSNSSNWINNNNINTSNSTISANSTSNNVVYRNSVSTNSTNNSNVLLNNGTNVWRNNVNSMASDSQWSFNGNLSNNLWGFDHSTTLMQNLLPGDLLNGEST